MSVRCVLLLIVVVVVVACRPIEEDAGPRIAVDACATNETEDCELYFGERDLSVRVQDSVVVANASVTSPLTMLKVDLIGDPAFRIVNFPDVIAPLSNAAIIIDVRPNVEATLESRLVIVSDATNAPSSPEGELVDVSVRVNGVNNGVPDITVAPLACAFDDATPTCVVSIENTGNRALVVDELLVTCEGPCPFSIDDPTPASILPDDPLVFESTFTPEPGSFSGTLTIISSDPDESFLQIALSATSS